MGKTMNTAIKSVSVINFQSHKNSTINLVEGINAILGESDKGKSVFVRAIRWVAENRPSGDSYISTFANGEDTVVLITFTDNNWVERRKGKGINSYTLSIDGDEQVFKAMGQDVPQEVKDFLKLRPVNFQFQMDSPFLLSASSSEVAQYLNKEAKLDIIDLATSNIRKKILNNNQDLGNAKRDLKKAEEGLLPYENLDELSDRLLFLETKELSLVNKQAEIKKLSTAIDSIKVEEIAHSKFNSIVSKLSAPVTALKEITSRIERLRDGYRKISSIINSYKQAKFQSESFAVALSIGIALPDMQTKLNRLNKIEKEETSIFDMIENINSLEAKAKKYRDEEKLTGEMYQKAVPAICPTCKQPWSKGKQI